MSSVECLREFVNERLTAAAEEIFRVFKKAVVEYEEEIDRQRRLLDIVWKPGIKYNTLGLYYCNNTGNTEIPHFKKRIFKRNQRSFLHIQGYRTQFRLNLL